MQNLSRGTSRAEGFPVSWPKRYPAKGFPRIGKETRANGCCVSQVRISKPTDSIY
jgi:hypothetical protein